MSAGIGPMAWWPSTTGPCMMSTVSTMAKRTGSVLAASCPSRCAWSPGFPITTPSRTAFPVYWLF
uniref:Alternative protein DENND3 n=1 Tax=Homo sapiens TaxID=9606 RepID=L8E848_HUMAN|nr:alternative protein DENND3 [Homo sapiens]